jgi:hypothetical protein
VHSVVGDVDLLEDGAAPSSDNLGAMASPRPFAPPVTTATLPLNRDMLCS